MTAENLPILHTEHAVAPLDAEYLPATHLVHSSRPDCVLYFPATHITQSPISMDLDDHVPYNVDLLLDAGKYIRIYPVVDVHVRR